MDKLGFISNFSPEAIDELYVLYKTNPASINEQWQLFFKGFDLALANYNPSFKTSEIAAKEFKVVNLITAYRQRGHLFTQTNPVRNRRTYKPTLDIEEFGLDKNDLDAIFDAGLHIGLGKVSLQKIIDLLQQTYCHSIGVEYLYIREPQEISWLRNKMEKDKNTPNLSNTEKLHTYQHLVSAVGFEKFIHQRFIGQKRFSLEGAESLIPSLNAVIERGADLGIEEFILGMSHRGRLNVLANILKKPYEQIFREFTGKSYINTLSLGDVKYHLGFENEIITDKGKKVRLNLVPNPSHLEAVGPVVQGISHAKIKNSYFGNPDKLAPIIIHGDSAIAGQGVVYEVIQMSELTGYQTGGTIHLVINNQVGFTTDYLEARSSTYCTDVAKVTRCPVFHVNGDDAEALVYTIRLAIEYRQMFHKDVFIDILCYRKHGHNEGDEPRYTQPLLYQSISKHPNPRDIYGKKITEEEVSTREQLNELIEAFDQLLDAKLLVAQQDSVVAIEQFLKKDWQQFRYSVHDDFLVDVDTTITEANLIHLAKKINDLPNENDFFKKLIKLVEDRKAMIVNDSLDWAMGELLAYASLIEDGIPVRLSGQDSKRGTFSHRHASLTRESDGTKYTPLSHLFDNQASFDVYNSPLNEYAVLGFEYGYALATPYGLNIWEAQFGDFHNVAQVIVDQYISSAEEKWGLMNGLVLMLPHGYEGQGPEHSSARIERFLILCARSNIQVLNCTTPANIFHALRMQVKRNFRTPMVIFTPKSLLRHPNAISTISDFTKSQFKRIIDDSNNEPEKVTRIVLCTGKLYYDLLKRKEELHATDIALLRIEQLYPFPKPELLLLFNKYKNALKIIWAQEEPMNMGAWFFIKNQITEYNIEGVYRIPSASPAVGLNELHHIQQDEIINKIFKPCTCELKNKYCGLQCFTGKQQIPIFKQYNYFNREISQNQSN